MRASNIHTHWYTKVNNKTKKKIKLIKRPEMHALYFIQINVVWDYVMFFLFIYYQQIEANRIFKTDDTLTKMWF